MLIDKEVKHSAKKTSFSERKGGLSFQSVGLKNNLLAYGNIIG